MLSLIDALLVSSELARLSCRIDLSERQDSRQDSRGDQSRQIYNHWPYLDGLFTGA